MARFTDDLKTHRVANVGVIYYLLGWFGWINLHVLDGLVSSLENSAFSHSKCTFTE